MMRRGAGFGGRWADDRVAGFPNVLEDVIFDCADELFGREAEPVVVHCEGRVAYVNRPLAELVGLSAGALCGRASRELYPDAAGYVQRVQQAEATGRPVRAPGTLRTAAGSTVSVESALLLVPVESGQPLVVEMLRRTGAG